MRSIWNVQSRRDLQARFGTLRSDAMPAWGRMSAPQMIAHAADSLRMAMGELPCAPKRSLLRHTPFKQLVIYWLPWPKGVPTAPELLARAPASWSSDVSDLIGLIDRLGSRGPGGPFADHPAFGRLSGGAWGALMYRHMDHHLRQFGV
jgi:uncharacterized protein DUF1569